MTLYWRVFSLCAKKSLRPLQSSQPFYSNLRGLLEMSNVSELVDSAIEKNKVMVFSKSYCPFCTMAKEALNSTKVVFEVWELDERGDGGAIQTYLQSKTGSRTVPQVFIGGKFIGGGSETKALREQKKLEPMLKDCGAL